MVKATKFKFGMRIDHDGFLRKKVTRCSAIAERPRFRVRYSFRQK